MASLKVFNVLASGLIFSLYSCDSPVEDAQRCFDVRDYEKANIELKKAHQSDPEVIKLKIRIDSALAYVKSRNQIRQNTQNESKRKKDSLDAYPEDLRLLNAINKVFEDFKPPHVFEMSDVKRLLGYYQELEKTLDKIKRSEIVEVKSQWRSLALKYNRLRVKQGSEDRSNFGRALGRLYQANGTDVYVRGANSDHLVLEGIAFYNQYDRIDVSTALKEYVQPLGFKIETYQVYEGSDRKSSWYCGAYSNPKDWAYKMK